MKAEKKDDDWTSIRSRVATVQRLEQFKVSDSESLESVIKRAINTHEKVQELKKKKRLAQRG